MDQALKTFLVEMATDPGKLSEYLRDRETYLAGTELSQEARVAVLSGDQAKVGALMGGVLGGHTKKTAMKIHKRRKRAKPAKKKPAKKPAKKK